MLTATLLILFLAPISKILTVKSKVWQYLGMNRTSKIWKVSLEKNRIFFRPAYPNLSRQVTIHKCLLPYILSEKDRTKCLRVLNKNVDTNWLKNTFNAILWLLILWMIKHIIKILSSQPFNRRYWLLITSILYS